MSAVTIYYRTEDYNGWAPISHMVSMALKAFDAQFFDASGRMASRMDRLRLALLPMARGGAQGAIFIAQRPKDIARFAAMPEIRARHSFRALWIIDSFRTDHLPGKAVLSHFDLVAYMQPYDRAHYEGLVGNRALLLGWGADVLDLGSGQSDRPIDVLRVGRQPPAWDDDAATAAVCAAAGLNFQGRPPRFEDPDRQQTLLMKNWYARAKFVVAHSNLAAPADYTHSSKEYITGRWTDALAAGAIIAGRQPHSDMELIDWPGAALDFPSVDLEGDNLARLHKAVQDWRPQTALNNHLHALKRLDWRWRFAALAKRLGITPAPLAAEMARLKARVAEVERLLAQAS